MNLLYKYMFDLTYEYTTVYRTVIYSYKSSSRSLEIREDGTTESSESNSNISGKSKLCFM